MLQLVIACGGTGGHLTPGIALAQELELRGHSTLLLTSQKAVDSRLRDHYRDNLCFQSMPGCGFSLRPRQFLRFCGTFLQCYWRSRKLLRQQQSDAVIAFGGFGSLGIGLAARMQGIPLFLHESNQVMGKAIKLLSPLAKRVYIPAELKAQSPFASQKRYESMGYPLRHDFLPTSQQEARRQLNLPPNDSLLVVIGGSQGARPLVEWVRHHRQKFSQHRTHVLCLTGLGSRDEDHWTSHADGSQYLLRCQRFCDQMHLLYSAADLAVSRAGAGTIAELCHCHLPAILVPYPHAAHDHQAQNAMAMARKNAAVLISENSLAQNEDIWALMADKNRRDGIRKSLAAMDTAQNADVRRMAEAILAELVGGNSHA